MIAFGRRVPAGQSSNDNGGDNIVWWWSGQAAGSYAGGGFTTSIGRAAVEYNKYNCRHFVRMGTMQKANGRCDANTTVANESRDSAEDAGKAEGHISEVIG